MTRSMSKVQQARTDSEQRRDTRTLLLLDKYCDHHCHFYISSFLATWTFEDQREKDALLEEWSELVWYSSSESRTHKCLAWFCLGPSLRRLPDHFYPR